MRTLTLANVRAIMDARGVAHLGAHWEGAALARRIVGSANSHEPFLSNMIRALSLMPWTNSAAEWQRLEAALMVRAGKRAEARRALGRSHAGS